MMGILERYRLVKGSVDLWAILQGSDFRCRHRGLSRCRFRTSPKTSSLNHNPTRKRGINDLTKNAEHPSLTLRVMIESTLQNSRAAPNVSKTNASFGPDSWSSPSLASQSGRTSRRLPVRPSLIASESHPQTDAVRYRRCRWLGHNSVESSSAPAVAPPDC